MKQIILMASAATLLAGCATVGPDYNKVIQSVLKSSFESKHIATVDRLEQDAVQAACSEAEMLGKDLDPAVRVKLEAAEMATIKQPADGNYFGDWTKAGKDCSERQRAHLEGAEGGYTQWRKLLQLPPDH
jgi:L-cysteine S-thiosulfotransferase